MQLPWPPLRDSDLAALALERWDLHLGKPELLSASQPLLPTTFPVGFQTLPHQCSPFPPPTHSNSDHANKVAVSSFHIIHLKSLMSPIWLWEGVGRGGWP